MIFLFLMMLAQATAPQSDMDTVTEKPVLAACAADASAIPPFGESCEAKAQAKRVTEISQKRPITRTVEITRYRIMGDGRTIANERGEVVAVANPCLLPTEEKPKEQQASVNEPEPKPDGKKAKQPTGLPQSITRCETEKFAKQFVSPAGAGQ